MTQLSYLLYVISLDTSVAPHRICSKGITMANLLIATFGGQVLLHQSIDMKATPVGMFSSLSQESVHAQLALRQDMKQYQMVNPFSHSNSIIHVLIFRRLRFYHKWKPTVINRGMNSYQRNLRCLCPDSQQKFIRMIPMTRATKTLQKNSQRSCEYPNWSYFFISEYSVKCGAYHLER